MNAAENKRLLALDILRGITIAGMILVNNPGSWSAIYAPLEHASWNGLTPTDLVFPFFMFIMGASTYLSLKKFDFRCSRATVRKILRRVLVIFLIGIGIGVLKILRHVQRAVGRRSSVLGTDRTFVLDVRPDADPRRDATPGAELRRGGADRRNRFATGASRGSPRDCSPVISRSCCRDTDSKFPNKTSSVSSTEQYSARRTCTVRAISPSTQKDC